MKQFSAALIVCVFCSFSFAAPVTCSSPKAMSNAAFEYFVSVADRDAHKLHIAIRYHGTSTTIFAMPVWNALYQVRDFSQYVTDLHATDAQGHSLVVTALDKTTWQVAAANGCAILEYTDFANVPGPFSAEANNHHVFVNWAQVLLHVPAQRAASLMLTVTDVPPQWSLYDLGLFDESPTGTAYHLAKPVTYDALIDSPVEIGAVQTSIFYSDGAHYRLVVDADPADYSLPALQDAIRKVVHAEVDWMQDRPFDQYTIIYHFPHGPIGGGMEHSYGTSIAAPAERLKANTLAPITTTAHEFFHLWNVKRIRPQAMEPIDFEHEQYTRSLWFCEGVTSTASELIQVRAGLEDERAYLAHLSDVITEFESHPARKFQSPEASSLDAWMEGHDYYRRPERSVSYYTSGEVLGTLLDLRIREATHGAKSLRDLFVYLNAHYAKQGRYYDDEHGLQQAAEAVAGKKLDDFFDNYVRGTTAIPYDDFLQTVGLKLQKLSNVVADAGFDATINFSGLPEVTLVVPGSAAEAAGVRVGDTLAEIDNHQYAGDLASFLVQHKPGDIVSFRFTSRRRTVDVKVTLQGHTRESYSVVDLPSVSAAQHAQRAAWIRGDNLGAQK
jgi:predicted metalloprotease with PDZ domain